MRSLPAVLGGNAGLESNYSPVGTFKICMCTHLLQRGRGSRCCIAVHPLIRGVQLMR